MHPTLINMGGYVISSYGAAMLLAFVVSIIPVLLYFPRKTLSLVDIYNFCLIVIAAIFIGGPLIQLFLFQNVTLIEVKGIFQFWNRTRDFASFPTLLATLVMMWLYCKLKHIPFLATLDFLFPYAILALAIQRTLGCFSAGCCYGLPTELPWGMHFPDSSPAGAAFPHFSIHPTQFYYGLSTLAIFLFLMGYKRYYQNTQPVGEITAMGLVLLSLTYFMITFLRGDLTAMIGTFNLTLGQQLAITLFFGGMILYAIVRWRKPNSLSTNSTDKN
ncbi:MAG: prolipoprotein diacylglyceryl transferase family protein [Candidatus Parabeggiatoa sp.]|nr:prolipoprotein diacylglyceryl transferase family protein [Candidatus Parabeggiatoa sp.]